MIELAYTNTKIWEINRENMDNNNALQNLLDGTASKEEINLLR